MFPKEKGSYVLILKAPKEGKVTIGKFGELNFSGHWMVYVGSALGPGGLKSRLNRHLRKDKKLHWHVDYLLERVEVQEVWYSLAERKLEEEWAAYFRNQPNAVMPLKGFGAADCRCPGHLVAFPRKPAFEDFLENVENQEEVYRVSNC